jgi:pimeloyl-ACP methyl ester carboxylesterase
VRLLALVAVCATALAAATTGGAVRLATDFCLRKGETAVHLRAADGAPIYGVVVGRGTTGVVLGHQFLSDHCEWMDFARELARKGYRALAIDFRGNGLSRGGNGPRLDLDVAAAAARLRADGVTRIELVGASMGGTAVLVAAARIRPAVNGVLSLSGPARYNGLDAVQAVRRSRVPVRFVADRRDGAFADDARTLERAAAAKDKGILLFADGLHGSQLLALPKARAYVLAFLAR